MLLPLWILAFIPMTDTIAEALLIFFVSGFSLTLFYLYLELRAASRLMESPSEGQPRTGQGEIRSILSAVFFFKGVYAFVLGYICVNLLFLWALRMFPAQEPLLTFLTSPLNAMESRSQLYSSISEGLNLNFVLIAGVIGWAECYSRFVLSRLNPYLTVYRVLGLATIASYVVSASTWRFIGFPSSGTSIIGTCVLTCLSASAIMDLGYIRGGLKSEKKLQAFLKFVLWFASVFIPPILVVGMFVLGNPSATLHLAGLLVFLLLLVPVSYRLRKTRVVTENPDAEARLPLTSCSS